MASVQDVRDLVSSYVSGEIPASDLVNRFMPVLKAAIKSNDSELREFALAVHAQLAHYVNGFTSEDQMKFGLQAIPSMHSQEAGYAASRLTALFSGKVYVVLLTFNKPLTPIRVSVEKPAYTTGCPRCGSGAGCTCGVT